MDTDTRWLDRHEYPFDAHYLQLRMGRMHYVDEGQGSPIVMVHGTPTWSFLYRHLIKRLSSRHRCIAPDHIGFGLSDKPQDWSSLPAAHAENLERLIDEVQLKDITLVVHDFGGPIGLAYALRNPDNVRRLVLFNTWMWSLKGQPQYERMSQMMGTRFGRFLYQRLAFSPRVMIPLATGDRKKLTAAIHRHYLATLPSPADRLATWVFARELIGSSAWYDRLWQQRSRISDIPTRLLWGLKDPAFGRQALARWQGLFTQARTVEFEDAGHFVQEEKGEESARLIGEFMDQGESRTQATAAVL